MNNITISNLEAHLKQLCLSAFAANYFKTAKECEKEDHLEYLRQLISIETEYRLQKRIGHLLNKAKLPRNKTLQSFDHKRIEGLSWLQVKQLATGEFMDRHENILIFGNPGTGKTHLAIALAQEWCLQGRKVHYTTSAQLMQNLLKAKKELSLNAYIKKLNYFAILIIDDISYISCDKEETDVLFTLLAARYESKSVLITSNLPFAKWDQIFKDQMTTAAAVDRLVHHAHILELNAESYRIANAKKRSAKQQNSEQREVQS
jgi:DNA replication protein DnaC